MVKWFELFAFPVDDEEGPDGAAVVVVVVAELFHSFVQEMNSI